MHLFIQMLLCGRGAPRGAGCGSLRLETGKYSEVWCRINDKWLIIRDMWNDDAPPAPAPPK